MRNPTPAGRGSREVKEGLPKKNNLLQDKLKEAVVSVVPVTGIVLLLCFSIAPLSSATLLSFLIGAIMLIVGMALFSLGTELAMSPIGEHVGSQMTKSRKLWVIVVVGFVVGVIITMSEPDLQVLAQQVPAIPNMVIIGAVSLGVGFFLVVALLRILFKIKLRYLLVGFYALTFLLAQFVDPDFLAVAFDSGGVTTGPMTVPFIMALGVGIASIRSDSNASQDSFGLVALCSVGPILAVLVMGMLYPSTAGAYVPVTIPEIENSVQLGRMFLEGLPTYMGEVALAVAPIVAFFALFQIISLKLKLRQLVKIFVGVLYTYLGLVLFLTGVNVGFMPAGNTLGQVIGQQTYRWVLVPIGMVIGYFIVEAEPAVHVLNKQVEEITSGAIPQKAMSLSLSIGVAVSIGLAMVRVLTGLSILWFLLPGYALAILLSFCVPPIFTSIAFDSGGVASGPMTATFLLPFAMGACEAVGGNIVADAFGVVAMVAMTPLIAIQVLGLTYKFKLKKQQKIAEANPVEQEQPDDADDASIIEL